MTKFFNKFEKACFWPIFGPLSQFWGQKNQLCHTQLHMGFWHHAKIYKNLMMQFQENAERYGRTDGRTEGQKDPTL